MGLPEKDDFFFNEKEHDKFYCFRMEPSKEEEEEENGGEKINLSNFCKLTQFSFKDKNKQRGKEIHRYDIGPINGFW